MTRQVDYSTWVIVRYRLMQTVQECQNCGHLHKGNVASEAYIVSERGRNGKLETRSDKVSVILARYAHYLGGKPEDHMDKLPAVECVVEQVKVPVEQCARCFNIQEWCMQAGGVELLPAEPLNVAKVNALQTKDLAERMKLGKLKSSSKANAKRHKPVKPAAKVYSLDDLMKDI